MPAVVPVGSDAWHVDDVNPPPHAPLATNRPPPTAPTIAPDTHTTCRPHQQSVRPQPPRPYRFPHAPNSRPSSAYVSPPLQTHPPHPTTLPISHQCHPLHMRPLLTHLCPTQILPHKYSCLPHPRAIHKHTRRCTGRCLRRHALLGKPMEQLLQAFVCKMPQAVGEHA